MNSTHSFTDLLSKASHEAGAGGAGKQTTVLWVESPQHRGLPDRRRIVKASGKYRQEHEGRQRLCLLPVLGVRRQGQGIRKDAHRILCLRGLWRGNPSGEEGATPARHRHGTQGGWGVRVYHDRVHRTP